MGRVLCALVALAVMATALVWAVCMLARGSSPYFLFAFPFIALFGVAAYNILKKR